MHDGRLLVFDFTRIVLFDLDGTHLETIQTGHEIPFQAEVMTIAGDGSIAQTFRIPEGPGDLQTADTEGGMSMYLTLSFSISHIDSRGRYWKIPITDDGPRSVVLLDAGFRETGDTIVFPEEIESLRFAESPRGEILAIQEWSSRILICRLVE